MTETTIETKQ